MKKIVNYFVFSILISLAYFSRAQQIKIDSLQTLLKNSKADTTKVNALNSLSGQYRTIGNYELALKYGQEAEQLARTKTIIGSNF